MFEGLAKKFQNLFTGKGELSEKNIFDAAQEVRTALLEADVNYTVVNTFIERVKQSAAGKQLIKSVSPREQFIKIVHEELMLIMGKDEASLNLKPHFSAIMMCGLQGSGKTTQTAKLAHYLNKQKKGKILLAACDLQRPAAIEQLKKLAKDINIEVFELAGEKNPVKVAKKALERAHAENYNILIVDTAGRLHVEDALMEELIEIKKVVSPTEILYVANATTGQDAVNAAVEFDKRVNITGSILTMLDGDARAGAAISITEVTKKPLKFEGVGEKIGDLQPFNPRSMADRVLGMGDIVNLVRKAEDVVSKEESEKLEKKLRKAEFTYDDYLKQMAMIKKMGSVKSLAKMIPGFSQMPEDAVSDEGFKKMESIILSMTKKEREERVELDNSRKKRIAKGSATTIDDVNKMVKGFKQIKLLLKNMSNKGFKERFKEAGSMGSMPDLNQMKKKVGGKLWRL